VVDGWDNILRMPHHLYPSLILTDSFCAVTQNGPKKSSSLASAASRARRCMHGAQLYKGRKNRCRTSQTRGPPPTKEVQVKRRKPVSFLHPRHRAFYLTPPRDVSPSPRTLARPPKTNKKLRESITPGVVLILPRWSGTGASRVRVLLKAGWESGLFACHRPLQNQWWYPLRRVNQAVCYRNLDEDRPLVTSRCAPCSAPSCLMAY